MPSTDSAPVGNLLLDALPRKDRLRFLAGCETVELVFADILSEPGNRIRHVYFPTKGMISLVAPMDGFASLEVGLVGNEGMLGTALVLGVDDSLLHALVQGGGSALRMSEERGTTSGAARRASSTEVSAHPTTWSAARSMRPATVSGPVPAVETKTAPCTV